MEDKHDILIDSMKMFPSFDIAMELRSRMLS
jgi:hypothetical protein